MPTARSSTSKHDPARNVVYQTDELGRVTQMRYDSRNRLVEVIRPDDSSTVTRYDGRGNVVGILERGSSVGYYPYTISSDPATLIRETKLKYDERGLLVKKTLPDPDGLITVDTDRNNDSPVTTYRYDAVGNLVFERDPVGHTTPWQNPVQCKRCKWRRFGK